MYDPTSDAEDSHLQQSSLSPNAALMLTDQPQMAPLRSTLTEALPYCCGTLDLPDFVLYYSNAEYTQHNRVDLLKADHGELDLLEGMCDPASFGVNRQDIVDPSYRKAGKLDKSRFSVALDIEHSGLIHAIGMGLLAGQDESRPIDAELYKLNVYGKDAFFKAHKDTPRGSAMFGSLVLVFPTPHAGGELVLRLDGREWTFNAAELISNTSRIAYVAFFSDVEHEIKPVTAGHRVTLTYNLSFAETECAHAQLPPGLHIVQPRSANQPAVQATLGSLLDDPVFLPYGGTLGFGLRHLYALPSSFDAYGDTTLELLQTRLKGSDAALFRACTALRLSPALYAVFEDEEATATATDARAVVVACPRVVRLHTRDTDEEDEPLWEKICRLFDGVLLNPAHAHGGRVASRAVQWVTALSDLNRVKTRFAAYGNEPMIGYLYQRICLLVDVGPVGRRDEI